MGRWEPDAAGRLGAAAMDLFAEQGYDETTVADIAARAGLTARTFFRHYADKREVLFAGSEVLTARMREALAGADPRLDALGAVREALLAGVRLLGTDRPHARRRQDLIAAHAELLERERAKLAGLADLMAAGLRERGVAEPGATLAAESGAICFRIGFERWAAASRDRDLAAVMDEVLGELRAVAAG